MADKISGGGYSVTIDQAKQIQKESTIFVKRILNAWRINRNKKNETKIVI